MRKLFHIQKDTTAYIVTEHIESINLAQAMRLRQPDTLCQVIS
jgi:hypothetical protein